MKKRFKINLTFVLEWYIMSSSTNQNIMSIEIYHYFKSDLIDGFSTGSKMVTFEAAVKTVEKMRQHNLPEYTRGFVIMTEHKDDNNPYESAPNSILRYFDDSHRYNYSNKYIVEQDFNSKLADAIIMNSLGDNKDVIDDFKFEINGSDFLFTSFRIYPNDSKFSRYVYAIFALHEEAEYFIDRDWHRNGGVMSHVFSIDVECFNKLIESGVDISIIKQIQKDCGGNIISNVLKSFARSDFNNIKIVDYDHLRLESNPIKSIVQIAEYLGLGVYGKDMKKEVADDIRSFIMNWKANNNFVIEKELKLGDISAFYTGKGPNREKLIVLS